MLGPTPSFRPRLSRTAILLGLLVACDPLTDPHAPPWVQIATAGVSPRWGQTAQYDAKRDRMLVFGGDGPNGELSELLVLHLDTLSWERTDTLAALSPRTDLGSALDTVRDRLILIGGRQGLATSIDEVWALDLTTNTWQRLPSGPPARHDIAAASDGAHAWVFGGAGGFLQSLDDFWQLDFATDTWTELPTPTGRPKARGSNALIYLDGAVYLVGGHDVASVQRDVWRYDLTVQAWSKVDFTGGVPAWAHFGYAVDVKCHNVILEGGDNLDNQDIALGTNLVLSRRRAPVSLLPAAVTALHSRSSLDDPRCGAAPAGAPGGRRSGRRPRHAQRRLDLRPAAVSLSAWVRILAPCLAATSLAGCYSFSSMGRARIVEAQRFELWAAPEALIVATSSGAGVRPIGEVGLRYGVSSVVEVDGSVNTLGIAGGTRLQLFRSRSPSAGFDVALAPGVAFIYPDKAAAQLPLLVGLNLPGKNQLVLSVRVAYQQHYGVGGVPWPINFVYVGTSLGFAWQATPRLALMPEVSLLTQVYADPGFSSNVANALGIQAGVGILFDP